MKANCLGFIISIAIIKVRIIIFINKIIKYAYKIKVVKRYVYTYIEFVN